MKNFTSLLFLAALVALFIVPTATVAAVPTHDEATRQVAQIAGIADNMALMFSNDTASHFYFVGRKDGATAIGVQLAQSPSLDEAARFADQTAGIAHTMSILFANNTAAKFYFLGRRDSANEIAGLLRYGVRIVNTDGLATAL